MNYNQRSDDAIKTELEYLREYIGRVFGKPLLKESFQNQVQDMIDQKIQDYIFQRYRDWTAPELARLKEQWDAQPETPSMPESKSRRQRSNKSDSVGA